jgi:hypothetical protein
LALGSRSSTLGAHVGLQRSEEISTNRNSKELDKKKGAKTMAQQEVKEKKDNG